MTQRKSRAELRALAEQTTVGAVMQAQLELLNKQEDALIETLDLIQKQLEGVRNQQTLLIDQFQFLTICMDTGEEYSPESYKRHIGRESLYSLSKGGLRAIAKRLGIDQKLPEEELMEAILNKTGGDVLKSVLNSPVNKEEPNV